MKKDMKFTKRKTSWALAAVVLLLTVFTVAQSYGATWDYYLQAGPTSIPAGTYNAAAPTVPNEKILMWGYQICNSTFTTCGSLTAAAHMPPAAADITPGAPTFPGPVLVASEGDTINIHLRNNLTTAAATTAGFPSMITEPTSLIIMGQNGTALTPVWVSVDANGGVTGVTSSGSAFRPAGDVTSRVRSFNKETPANGSTVITYTWTSLRPGTFLYETGTHPAVQAQMGLYGALKVYPTASPVSPGVAIPIPRKQAYNDASTAYYIDVTLVFSEVDQELHYSVGSGLYGTPPPPPPGPVVRGQRTSTVDYAPNFFLINGKPYTSTLPAIANAGAVGSTTLLRLVNAGLKEKTPTILNPYMFALAEDGNLYTYVNGAAVSPYTVRHTSLLLPAGKTMDATIAPTATGNLALFDRSLNLTNSNLTNGGMLTYLNVTATQTLSADTVNITAPAAGATLTHGANKTITWTHSGDPGPVKIELIQLGVVIQTIADAAAGTAGSYSWTVPTVPPGNYKVMITTAGGSIAKTGLFTIN